MTHRPLKTQILWLILVPTLLLCLILAILLSRQHINHTEAFINQRGSAISSQLALLSQLAVKRNDTEVLPELLYRFLGEPYVRALAIHLEAGAGREARLFSAGPPMQALPREVNPAQLQPQRLNLDGLIRHRHPIPAENEGASPGWVEVELTSSPHLVLQYESLLISLLLLVLGGGLCGLLARRFYLRLSQPLGEITRTVEALGRDELDQKLPAFQNRELNLLAQSVNRTAESLQQTQSDTHAYLEQSTRDLRETLETIEVQNIELNMARKKALEASRIKSEFLANTSHEIRTPLNGILGFTNLALKTRLNEQQHDYLLTIRNSSQHLLTVINDILDFSKLESGKLTLDYAPLSLRTTLEEATTILAPGAHEKQLELITLIDPKVPLRLLGDALRLKQVVTNLVSNAIKFSHRGNIILGVTLLEQNETQAKLRFSVSDQGPGLTRDQQEQLFQAFNQADNSSSRAHGGTGLGLVICKGLVERMEGEIGVDSQPEQGARFWFNARLGIAKQSPPDEPPAPLKGQTLVICGANPKTREQLAQLVHQGQGQSEQYETPYDLFPRLREAPPGRQRPRLAVLDIAPDEQNLNPQLLARLAQQLAEEFDCALVACCTPAQRRFVQGEQPESPIHFAIKPITQENLLETLTQALGITQTLLPKEQASDHKETDARAQAKILVVDDNPANLQLACELLQDLDTQVYQAQSGTEALELCRQEYFDLIFMDIQMPGMDGIETTRQLRREHSERRTPIIALTAHSMTEEKSNLLIAGMDDCVTKPVIESQLAHIINRWVQLSGRQSVVAGQGNQRPRPLDAQHPPNTRDKDPGPVDIPLSLKLANHKPTLARDMLAMLLDSLESERESLEQAFAARDFPLLQERVHRLYGSSCYCGVPRLKRLSGLLDKILQNGQFDQVRSPLSALDREMAEILKWAQERPDWETLFEERQSDPVE